MFSWEVLEMHTVCLLMDFALLLAVCILVGVIFSCVVLYKTAKSIETVLIEHLVARKYEALVEEVEASDDEELPLGLYRAEQEDAVGYVNEKAEELRLSRISPYNNWDWSEHGDSKEP